MKPVAREISKQIQPTFEKQTKKQEDTGVKVWDIPYFFNQQPGKVQKHNEISIAFKTMREFSVLYPIARACINFRKSQLQQLRYDFVYDDDNAEDDLPENVKKELIAFFKHPIGPNKNFRHLLDQTLEDLLVMDAVAIYKQKTVGGGLNKLIPVDASTIQLLVDEAGMTPEPPETAYKQVINGRTVADLTTEELYYNMLNPRTSSPYGLSPIETLVTTISTALRSAVYNEAFFSEGNVPEGFIELPEEVAGTPDKAREWMSYFNAMLAGNPREMNRLHILPQGANYTPTKKPEDMRFERFELWLMQNTCAVFQVPPEELGFTHNINRATAETQKQSANDTGLRPLALFIEEMMTDIIQQDMGLGDIKFKFIDLDNVDDELEIARERHEIDTGIKSVDEARIERGLEPIGLSNYVSNSVQLATTLIDPPEQQQPQAQIGQVTQDEDRSKPQQEEDKPEEEDQEDEEAMMEADLITWRKKAVNDIKRGYDFFRPFTSKYISEDMVEDIEDQLAVTAHTKEAVRGVFAKYLSPAGKLLEKAAELNKQTHELLAKYN